MKLKLFNGWSLIVERQRQRPTYTEIYDQPHHGKAMCVNHPEGVTIKTECVTCGELKLGPIYPVHLRSIAAMIDGMADTLEIPPRHEAGIQTVTKGIFPSDIKGLEKAAAEFEDMPLQGAEGLAGRSQTMSPADLSRMLQEIGKPGKVH